MDFDFSFVTGFIPDSAMGWVNAGALAVACSSGVAAAISKLTANKTDDKIAGWLTKAHDLLAGVGLHGHNLAQKRVAQKRTNQSVSVPAIRKVDHRRGK